MRMSVKRTPTSVCLVPATITQAALSVCANQALFSPKMDDAVTVNLLWFTEMMATWQCFMRVFEHKYLSTVHCMNIMHYNQANLDFIFKYLGKQDKICGCKNNLSGGSGMQSVQIIKNIKSDC